MSDPNEFVNRLVADLKPTPPARSAWLRTVLWFSSLVVATVSIATIVHEFRPNFQDHLIQYWRLDIEIVSGAALAFLISYIVFAASVPGKNIKPTVVLASLTAFLAFAGAVAMSFWTATPEASSLGARPFCELEVLVYGGLFLAGFVYLVRQGLLDAYSPQNLLSGFSAGLVPALVMQLACMYDPKHALMFHFGPAVLLGILGWVISAKIKTVRDKKSKAFFSS